MREAVSAEASAREPTAAPEAPDAAAMRRPTGALTEALFDDVARRPDGALAVTVDGRALKLTNWDKVLYPETGFTKGDLIAYYARIAPGRRAAPQGPAADAQALPQRRRLAVLLREAVARRTGPNGSRRSTVADVDYTLAQDRATLVWLANLADIELHTSLSLRADPQRPTMLVFDLDPGAPAGLVECCEVALVLQRAVRGARARERGQDLGVQGDAGVRAAQHRDHLRADQAVCARRSPSCWSSGCPSSSSAA